MAPYLMTKSAFYLNSKSMKVNFHALTVQIKRGFRHQIRCHLCWMGLPIQNDPLYSHNEETVTSDSILALRSHALFFPDPASGKRLEYIIEALN